VCRSISSVIAAPTHIVANAPSATNAIARFRARRARGSASKYSSAADGFGDAVDVDADDAPRSPSRSVCIVGDQVFTSVCTFVRFAGFTRRS
jgi:hypothetical protein